MESFKDLILSILFTRRCEICGDTCDIRHKLCEECIKDPCRINGEICYKCGLPKKECGCRNNSFRYYMSVCAPFYYDNGPKRAIKKLKFRNEKSIVENLAKEMVNCINARYDGCYFEYCTFVPSHKKDRKARGYNQAELLAKQIAKELNIPCYPLLKKEIQTPPQHKLPAYRRTGNLASVFSCNDIKDVDITDARILLCDDVTTTGTTLNECTKPLLFNGAAEVRCITACITKNYKPQKEESTKNN